MLKCWLIWRVARCATSCPNARQALHGQIEPHHQVLLGQLFAHMSYLEQSIAHLQLQIEQRLSPFEEAKQLLLGIPGIQEIAAAAILAEIGMHMSRFPSDRHLASWAGVCPGNKPARRQASLRQDHHRPCSFALRPD